MVRTICKNPLCKKEFYCRPYRLKSGPIFCSRACPVRPVTERFWENVFKTKNCWFWIGATNGTYGLLFAGAGKGNRTLKAHKISWALHFGPVPKNKCVLHDCDTPTCVNPKHLFLGTYRDNRKDAVKKGRAVLHGRVL